MNFELGTGETTKVIEGERKWRLFPREDEMKVTVKTIPYSENSMYSRCSFILGLEDVNELCEMWDWADKTNPPLTDFLPLDEEFCMTLEETLMGEEWDGRSVVGVFYPILVRGAEIGRTYRGRFYFLFPTKVFVYFCGSVAVKDVFDLNIIKSKTLGEVIVSLPTTKVTVLYGYGRPVGLYEEDLNLYAIGLPYTKKDVIVRYGNELLSHL